MLPIVLKESWKAHLKAMMSWTIAFETGVVTSTDLTLRAKLGLVVGGWRKWVLRACRGCYWVAGGCLC